MVAAFWGGSWGRWRSLWRGYFRTDDGRGAWPVTAARPRRARAWRARFAPKGCGM